MGSPTIFSGRRTKLLTADGLLRSDGGINDNDGTRNYIANGHAEVNTTGWATYADAAGTRPVDGTGGSPTVTFTRSTSSPLAGQGSFLFTKDAANRQGQGASYAFTIDSKDQARVLNITAEYIVSSGTFVAGSSTTDSDVIIYLYDVTNAVLIEPSSIKLFSSSTTISDKFSATFQTASNSTSYRLIIHCASTSASAYVLKFKDIKVSPSVYIFGSTITDATGYAPTLSNATNATVNKAAWSRRGDKLYGNVFITWSGAGGGSTFTVSLPAGLTIDTAKIQGTVQSSVVGWGMWQDSGTAFKAVNVGYYTNTTFTFEEVTASAGTLVGTGFANNDTLSFFFEVPITGWGSSTALSTDTDTRVVAASASIASSATTTTATTINFATVIYDTHGGITTGASWKYNIFTAGFYRVSVNIDANTATHYKVYKTNVDQGYIAYHPSSVFGTGSRTIYCVAGDYLDVRPDTGATVQATSYISIEKVQGPAAIADSETIVMYTTNQVATGTINGSYNAVKLATVTKDTHGGYSTTTGLYTVYAPGFYRLTGIMDVSATFTAGQYLGCRVGNVTTGEYHYGFVRAYGSATTDFTPSVTGIVYAKAGDTLGMDSICQGTSPSFSGTLTGTEFSVERCK